MASAGEGDRGTALFRLMQIDEMTRELCLSGNPRDQILDLGIKLLKDFIYNWIRRHADNITLTREELGAEELCEPEHKQVAQSLQIIGDGLEQNGALQTIIEDPLLQPSLDVFMRVALEIFSDGKFNWGRMVTFFYFVCKLVVKAYKPQILDLVRSIINWAIDFLRENLINWIREQGGWESVFSYIGTPKWQALGVFLAGILTAVIVMHKI